MKNVVSTYKKILMLLIISFLFPKKTGRNQNLFCNWRDWHQQEHYHWAHYPVVKIHLKMVSALFIMHTIYKLSNSNSLHHFDSQLSMDSRQIIRLLHSLKPKAWMPSMNGCHHAEMRLPHPPMIREHYRPLQHHQVKQIHNQTSRVKIIIREYKLI
jgi:hypothetical protein